MATHLALLNRRLWQSAYFDLSIARMERILGEMSTHTCQLECGTTSTLRSDGASCSRVILRTWVISVSEYATWRRTISSNYTYKFIALAVGHAAAIGLGISVFGRWWTAAKWFSVTGVGAALFGLYNACMYNPRSATYDLYCAIETLITRIKQSSVC